MASPGTAGPVGPFPGRVGADEAAQEEYDKLRRRVLWSLPYGLYVLGSRAQIGMEDRRNGMTVNWATVAPRYPALMAPSRLPFGATLAA